MMAGVVGNGRYVGSGIAVEEAENIVEGEPKNHLVLSLVNDQSCAPSDHRPSSPQFCQPLLPSATTISGRPCRLDAGWCPSTTLLSRMHVTVRSCTLARPGRGCLIATACPSLPRPTNLSTSDLVLSTEPSRPAEPLKLVGKSPTRRTAATTRALWGTRRATPS